jgi:hypothetical protein
MSHYDDIAAYSFLLVPWGRFRCFSLTRRVESLKSRKRFGGSSV